ncbi:MAG TPA: TIR domain-containing protein [Hyphomonadaceae bacterium]|nr:TIR domain-containing protein [Hyphomonadaceae bacterium]
MASCDVFISYKRGEGHLVEPIVRKLKELGLTAWYDTRLEAGPSFDKQIAAKLEEARVVLVCWTPAAIDSEWVRAEAATAQEAGKLTACFLKETKLIPPFNLIQTENLEGWDGEDDHIGWTKTFTRVASLSDNNDLIRWAALMSEGNPANLREWAAKQPPGSLRMSTRFWIAELQGAVVAIPDVSLQLARQRTLSARWGRLSWWQKSLAALALVGVLAGAYLGISWLTRPPTTMTYYVVFEGQTSVKKGVEVRFNGIPVGTVQTVSLDRSDPNRVIAGIKVDTETPVRVDSTAEEIKDANGVTTGLQIFAGSPDKPLLRSDPGTPAIIRSQRTALDELFQGGQDVAAMQSELLQKQLEYYKLAIDDLRAKAEQASPKSSEPAPDTSTKPAAQ